MAHPRTILDRLAKLSFSDRLALARTLMSNQRTGLAYMKGALGLLASGYALLKIEEHPLLDTLGVMGLLAGLAVMLQGLHRYRVMKKALGDISQRGLVELEFFLIEGDDAESSGRRAADFEHQRKGSQ